VDSWGAAAESRAGQWKTGLRCVKFQSRGGKTGKKTRGMWIAAELGGEFPFRRGRWKRFRRVEMEKWTWN